MFTATIFGTAVHNVSAQDAWRSVLRRCTVLMRFFKRASTCALPLRSSFISWSTISMWFHVEMAGRFWIHRKESGFGTAELSLSIIREAQFPYLWVCRTSTSWNWAFMAKPHQNVDTDQLTWLSFLAWWIVHVKSSCWLLVQIRFNKTFHLFGFAATLSGKTSKLTPDYYRPHMNTHKHLEVVKGSGHTGNLKVQTWVK